MSNVIKAIRGMKDVLPSDSYRWQFLETTVADILAEYGYKEIRMPLVEKTNLFKRSIGEVTDIVEKEMYTFSDLDGDSLSLRPEGTASCVRACVEHAMLRNQQQHRLWYTGPMFRHERPQKGRYRQFFQVGAEVFGLAGPDIDAEMLLMTKRMFDRLGLKDLKLLINTLGTAEERQGYRETLVAYLKAHFDVLDDDSKRRLETNPLRVLDSKNPDMQAMLVAAPKLIDSLGEESTAYFNQLLAMLDNAGLQYTVDARLVRGLDYYSHAVFEWVTDALGAQGTVCAGGRYDALVEQLGGPASPACGFAMGIERLLLLLEEQQASIPQANVDAYMVVVGETAQTQSLKIAEQIRDIAPGIKLQVNAGGGSFKSQFKKADRSGAKVALVMGDEEVSQQSITVKYLRDQIDQISTPISEIGELLAKL